jgi:sigma-B regulation protein RsbU (phosphoserine phosphatase)
MAAIRSRIRTHASAYAGLAALLLLSVTVFARDVSDTVDLVRHLGEHARPPFRLGDANWGAIGLQPEAAASGMKFGDAVLAVNGHPVDGFFVYYGTLRQARAGDRLRVQVQSPGPAENPIRDLSIELRPYRSHSDPAAGLSYYVGLALRVIALPLVCIVLGFWVTAVRIDDRSAWLLLVLMLSFPSYVGGGGIGPEGEFGREAILQPIFAGFGAFRGQVLPPALMLFGIAFPERLPLDRRFPWLKWVVAGYLVLVTTLVAIDVGFWVHHLAWARQVTQRPIQLLTGVEGDFGGAVSFVALTICAASLGWKTMTAPSRDARRRLLLLDVGAVPGVAALVTILVAGRLEVRLPGWSLLPLVTMMLAFPLAMAYVIVVHRAMDVRVVIRQGLQYVLARGGIRAIQIGILVAVSVVATSLLAGGAGIARVASVVAGMVGIVAIGGQFADRLRRWWIVDSSARPMRQTRSSAISPPRCGRWSRRHGFSRPSPRGLPSHCTCRVWRFSSTAPAHFGRRTRSDTEGRPRS